MKIVAVAEAEFYTGFTIGSLNLVQHYKDKHRLSFRFKMCLFFLHKYGARCNFCCNVFPLVFKEEFSVNDHVYFCVLTGGESLFLHIQKFSPSTTFFTLNVQCFTPFPEKKYSTVSVITICSF